MLRYLGPRLPRRLPPPSLKDIWLDDGRSRVLFNEAAVDESVDGVRRPQFLVTNHLPPAPGLPLNTESPNSSLCPPFHIHLREDEIFRVISGDAKFLLLDQSRSRCMGGRGTHNGIIRRNVSAGEVITIPRGQIHTFRNASSEQPLVLEFGFSPPGSATSEHVSNLKMRRFFLNTQLYRSDCTTQGVPRSLLQVLLFNHYADVALVPGWLLHMHNQFPSIRDFIEKYFASSLGRFMNLFGGEVLGKWLFGLKGSYEEYHRTNKLGIRTDASTSSLKSSERHDT